MDIYVKGTGEKVMENFGVKDRNAGQIGGGLCLNNRNGSDEDIFSEERRIRTNQGSMRTCMTGWIRRRQRWIRTGEAETQRWKDTQQVRLNTDRHGNVVTGSTRGVERQKENFEELMNEGK